MLEECSQLKIEFLSNLYSGKAASISKMLPVEKNISNPHGANAISKAESGIISRGKAFNSLLFLYKHVLNKPLGRIAEVVRARRPKHLPVVLTREEA